MFFTYNNLILEANAYIMDTVVSTPNGVLTDPLGQFEVLNIFSTSTMYGRNAEDSFTTVLAWFFSHFTFIYDIIFEQKFSFLQDTTVWSDSFNTFVQNQFNLFKNHLFIGLYLLQNVILQPYSLYFNIFDNSTCAVTTQLYTLTPIAYVLLKNSYVAEFFEDFLNTLNNTPLTYVPIRELSLYAHKYTPLTFIFTNSLVYQDYFLNFFINNTYANNIVMGGQLDVFIPLNMFGLMYDQYNSLNESANLLNTILHPQNTSIFYKHQQPSLFNKELASSFTVGNLLYTEGFGLFTKLFGLSLTDIGSILYHDNANNSDNNTQTPSKISEDELAFYIGFNIFLNFIKETEFGIESLWRNFEKLSNIFTPVTNNSIRAIYAADGNCSTGNCSTGNCSTGNCDTAGYCSIDDSTSTTNTSTTNNDLDIKITGKHIKSHLLHKIQTTYNLVPLSGLRHKEAIIHNSIELSGKLMKDLADSNWPMIAHRNLNAGKVTPEDIEIVSAFRDALTATEFVKVSHFSEIVYKLDKLFTIQKHTYNNLAALNLQYIPESAENTDILGLQNYNLWCYFQFKQHGDVELIQDKLKNTGAPSNPLTAINLYDGATKINKQASEFAALVCVDVFKNTENNTFDLDYAKVVEYSAIEMTNPFLKHFVERAFSICLNALEPLYQTASTPADCYILTEFLVRFMAYIVRGVLLNNHPLMFCTEVPYATEAIESIHQPLVFFINYQVNLGLILQPLLDLFNAHFGYTRFNDFRELIIFLLSNANDFTLADFAFTYGLEILFELVSCCKHIFLFAERCNEFKFCICNTSYVKSSDSVDDNAILTALHADLDTCMCVADTTKGEKALNITGPFSYFAEIIQQVPFLCVSLEQLNYLNLKHSKEVGQYEQFFNIYSEDFRRLFAQIFVQENAILLQGKSLAELTVGDEDRTFIGSESSRSFLSQAASNLIFLSGAEYQNAELFFLNVFIDFIANNQSVFIAFIILILSILFFTLPLLSNIKLVPLNWQFVMESLYKFILNILNAQVGKVAAHFFPYVFSIFSIVLVANIAGMTLYAFTLTSHILVTFTLGVSSFLGLTILGFYIQKLAFFNLFLPKGIPTALIPILLVVEIISYVSRALSLSIRLFANLMSGHTLLHILAFFSSKLFKVKYIVGLLSFLLILAIVVLEFCIAILQAYVFAILICIYLNDSFSGGH